MEQGYWSRAARRRISRRGVLRGAAMGGAGLATAALIGCGSDEESGGSATPAGNGTAAPTATSDGGGGGFTLGGSGEIINGDETYLGKEPVAGGSINTTYGPDPVSWDPHATTSINTHTRTLYWNTPLLQYNFGPEYGDANVQVSPNIAESWEQASDTQLIFKIDPAAVWTEREPLAGRNITSEDVKYTYERILGLPAPFAGQYSMIDSIDAPDEQTLVLNLTEPSAPIFNFLGHYYSQIIAPEVEEQFGDLSTVESARALGSGPFELTDWQPGNSMTVKRRENYWREGPYLDEIVQTARPDANASLAAFRAGELDISSLTDENMESFIQGRPDIVAYRSLSVVAWGVNFRLDQPVTEDERFRQAVAHAIDRQGWVDSIYHGHGTIDNGPIQALWTDWRLPPDQLGEGSKFYEFNPEESRKLLDAMGVDTFACDFYPYRGQEQSGELMSDFLGQIGIDLNVVMLEYGAYVGAVMNSDPTYDGMSMLGVRFMGDPDEMLWDMYHSTGSKNFSKVRDTGLEDMLVKQRQELDVEARKEIVNEIQRYLAVKNYYVYQPSFTSIAAWQPHVANWRPHVSYDHGNRDRGVWLNRA